MTVTPEVQRAVQASRHRLTHWLIATTPENWPREYHGDPRLFAHDVHVLIHESNEHMLEAMRRPPSKRKAE